MLPCIALFCCQVCQKCTAIAWDFQSKKSMTPCRLAHLAQCRATPPASATAATTHAPGADLRGHERTGAAASGRSSSGHDTQRLECRACHHHAASSRSHPRAAGPVPPTTAAQLGGSLTTDGRRRKTASGAVQFAGVRVQSGPGARRGRLLIFAGIKTGETCIAQGYRTGSV